MTGVIDLNDEFAKLIMLEGRTSTTTVGERQEAISRLVSYRDGSIRLSRWRSRFCLSATASGTSSANCPADATASGSRHQPAPPQLATPRRR